MSKQFTFPIAGDPAALFARARAAARQSDVALVGDETAGTFEGRGVEGAYRVDGDAVVVTVTKKPFIAPWGMVERTLRDFFGG